MRRSARHVKKLVVERDEAEDEASSEEEVQEDDEVEDQEDDVAEEVEDEDDEEEGGEDEAAEEPPEEEVQEKKRKKPISISLKGAKVCKVCKKTGHQAGFVGSVYMDCPNKPCYLCKLPGHTTMTCPYRTAPEHGSTPAVRRQSGGMIDVVRNMQINGQRQEVKKLPPIPNRVDAAVLKLHSRRVTSLEFHPTKDNIVVSGDKKGQIGIWDFEKVYDKTVYDTTHRALVNSIKFDDQDDTALYTAASDGLVSCTDMDTGSAQNLIDLNPNGWQGPATWKMVYGMDLCRSRQLIIAGDDEGFLHMVDKRTKKRTSAKIQIHNKGSKIVGVHCNPCSGDVFMTASNDHTAKIFDLRALDAREKMSPSLAQLEHPRVVNAAYFSPFTGSKILTTCQDNRLRVWDYIYGDLSEPNREIVHSHDFNRYLTPFKAEWDPRDVTENLVVIGRYISHDFDGVALHPVDFIDASTGELVGEVWDPNITTISPVNKLHPRLDVLATGSSRSLFIWRPNPDEEEDDSVKEATRQMLTEVLIYNAEEATDAKKKKKKSADIDDLAAAAKKKKAAG